MCIKHAKSNQPKGGKCLEEYVYINHHHHGIFF